MSSAAIPVSLRSSLIQRKMDLFNGLPENGTDRLQQEIADQLTRDKDPVDELQLAALLGKTLLEKNGELELKLRKLQDFAEETLATNQTLSRQLGESKDSLQFSNKLCEQLEAKVEELESTNRSLTRLCEGRKSLLDQKASDMTQMEAELSDVKDRFDGVQEDLNRLRRDSVMAATAESNGVGVPGSGRAHRGTAGSNTTDGREEGREEGSIEEITKLKGSIAELSTKLQNSTFQKSRLERELEGVLSENAMLAKNLERAEVDLAEMQVRFDEMLTENHALDSSSCTTPLSPSSSFNAARSHIRTPQMEPTSAAATTKGPSLFSELGSELDSLPERSSHNFSPNSTISTTTTLTQQGGGASGSQTTPTVQVRVQGKSLGTFKELFDEMFATLRQTAKVADRLIERRDGQ